jgi:hypothetical protein
MKFIKKFIGMSLTIFTCFPVLAQYDFNIDWAISTENIDTANFYESQHCDPIGMAHDSKDYLYFAGYTSTSIDISGLDFLPNGTYSRSSFLIKYDSSRLVEWNIDVNSGNEGDAYITDLAVNEDDEILIAGSYEDGIKLNGIIYSIAGSHSHRIL